MLTPLVIGHNRLPVPPARMMPFMAGKANGTGRTVDELIDAEQLARELSLDELNAAAEAYFAQVTDRTYLFAKPFGDALEGPPMLMHFAGMVHGLELAAGDQVLDFGAGACWTSRLLAQMHCHVIACDVSASALAIGQELMREHPFTGTGTVRYLEFDGTTLDLPSESLDRIAVMDAFHHVPNWPEVLAEFHRVLKPGGLVVMAEPGPEHSRTTTAQMEMRQFTVLERDVVVADLESLASAAGFARTSVGLYSGLPAFVAVDEFESELASGSATMHATRSFLVNHRLIRLHKGWAGAATSLDGAGLMGTIKIEWRGGLSYRATLTNTGAATWLGQDAEAGSVRLGIQILNSDGTVDRRDYQRVPLQYHPTRPVRPGESVSVEFDVVDPGLSAFRLGFDLVSEHVAWFSDVSGQPGLKTDLLPSNGSIR